MEELILHWTVRQKEYRGLPEILFLVSLKFESEKVYNPVLAFQGSLFQKFLGWCFSVSEKFQGFVSGTLDLVFQF